MGGGGRGSGREALGERCLVLLGGGQQPSGGGSLLSHAPRGPPPLRRLAHVAQVAAGGADGRRGKLGALPRLQVLGVELENGLGRVPRIVPTW